MLKSRLIYLALVIGSFIFSQALYEPISYMTFIIVLLLPFLSVLFAVISLPLIKVKLQTSKKSIRRFDGFKAQISLKTYSPFVSSLFNINCIMPDETGREVTPVTFMTNASLGCGSTFEYNCRLLYRGEYDVCVESVEYYDFLRLIKLKKNIDKKLLVTVSPRIIDMILPVSSDLQQQENSTNVGLATVLSGGDMVGVREYNIGDNLKNVHWKLSAKSENLIMKSFAEDIYDQALLVVDMSAYQNDVFECRSMTDCVVESALSALRIYSQNSVRFSLIINVSKNVNVNITVTSPTDLAEAERAVSKAKMVANTSVIDLLRGIDINTLSGSEVCIISSFTADDTIRNIKKIFINSKNKVKIIRITETEATPKPGVISFTRKYIENQNRGTVDVQKK